MKLYQVIDWSEHFENSKSRERDRCGFVCVPNKQAGLGFTRLMAEKDGAMIYGIWCLLLGALSRQRKPRGGWLTQDGHQAGTPWAVSDLALLWRRPEPEIERALTFLSSTAVGWIAVYDPSLNGDCPPTARAVPADCPPTALERREENEEKRKKEALFLEIAPKNLLASPEFVAAWGLWVKDAADRGRPINCNSARQQFSELASWPMEESVQSLKNAVSSRHSRPFRPDRLKTSKAKVAV
jgi:hypothetical protein